MAGFATPCPQHMRIASERGVQCPALSIALCHWQSVVLAKCVLLGTRHSFNIYKTADLPNLAVKLVAAPMSLAY